MKKLFLLLMLPVVALSSCSKDDNGGNNSGSTKLVKQLTMSGDNDQTYYFEYDSQQRVSTMTISGDGEIYIATYTYSGNTINVQTPEGEYVYTLDAGGYVVKFETFENDPEQHDGSEEYTYTSGQWSKTTGEAWFWDATYTWQNGNIVRTGGDEDGDTYAYNDTVDKMNIVICDINDDIWDGYPPFFISRFKGMTSKNLMSKKDYSYGDENRVYTFMYTLDNDGYPTKIVEYLNGDYYSDIAVAYY